MPVCAEKLAGNWMLQKSASAWVSSSFATALHTHADTGDAAGTDQLQGTSSHVMFLARGKVGPFRVEAQPLVGTDGTVAVRTLLHDEGNGDKAITAASYVFRSD